jgi:hypothetical protein
MSAQFQTRLLFGSFDFWSFNFVSDFEFRASYSEYFCFIEQSYSILTPMMW